MPIRRIRRKVKVIKPQQYTRSNKPSVVRTVRQSPNVIRKRKNSDLMYGTVNPIWDNETVYIVGGGPSLKNFNWSRLDGKKVIAVNRAYEAVPNADVLYWTDSRFYQWNTDGINNFRGLKVTCRPFPNPPPDIVLLKTNGQRLLDDRPGYITHGNNSGFGAISLALKLGATKIYLLGYDMHSSTKDTHWHDGYKIKHNHTIYKKMIQGFESLVPELNKRKIEVWNANPDSMLKSFRKCSLDTAISDQPSRTS